MARRRKRRSSPRRHSRRTSSHRRTSSRRSRRGSARRKHVHFTVRKGGRRRVVDFFAKTNGHTSARSRRKSPAFNRAKSVMKKANAACRRRHLRPFTKPFGRCVKAFFRQNF